MARPPIHESEEYPLHHALVQAGLTFETVSALRPVDGTIASTSPWSQVANALRAEHADYESKTIAVGDCVRHVDSDARGQVCGVFGTGTGSDRDREVYAAVTWGSDDVVPGRTIWLFPTCHFLTDLRKQPQ